MGGIDLLFEYNILFITNLQKIYGGEGGIRTHGTQKAHWFSRPAYSTALAPLR